MHYIRREITNVTFGLESSMSTETQCIFCGEYITAGRWEIGKKTCLACGDKEAVKERKGWCVLTPHKQGPMFFTREFAFEAARGINNKGGLVK
jgi:hypothetical protein